MADKKIEKALYGPSTVEVALGAVLGLLVGVVAACAYLVFKPVQTVKETPADAVRSVVYYVPGSTDAARGRGWQAKQAALVSGGEVLLSEPELNAWAASLGGSAPAAAAAGGNAAASGDFISASGLNFRLEGEQLQIAQKVLLNYFGATKEVIMQARGGFRRTSDGSFAFKPEQVHLGSCPLHLVPGATGALIGTLWDKQKVPDEFRAAWAKITAIAVEGDLLKVTTQP